MTVMKNDIAWETYRSLTCQYGDSVARCRILYDTPGWKHLSSRQLAQFFEQLKSRYDKRMPALDHEDYAHEKKIVEKDLKTQTTFENIIAELTKTKATTISAQNKRVAEQNGPNKRRKKETELRKGNKKGKSKGDSSEDSSDIEEKSKKEPAQGNSDDGEKSNKEQTKGGEDHSFKKSTQSLTEPHKTENNNLGSFEGKPLCVSHLIGTLRKSSHWYLLFQRTSIIIIKKGVFRHYNIE
jgi:hypothetical protein